ncbi:MAG: metal ABC transporter ATP-binding protein [Alphaproteobacteria bacterium]|jgi:zinc/manganese transport system ATP-binding protein|nr:metal ABC transporter ATP-binding protein [Alphaproteobacteria bacterium]
MLELSRIFYSYKDFLALEDISFEFPAKSLTAIIGPNGAGKSTLLKTIAGLITPCKGKLKWKSQVKLAYLPQYSLLDRSFPLTVFDVVAMGLWKKIGILGGLSHTKADEIHHALENVGLKGFEKRGLSELSGGQFQRLLFARMIVQDADFLLLDEPFAAVDEATTKDLLKLIQEWHCQGKSIVAVIHNLNLVRKYFPQTLLLAKKVVAFGETSSVLTTESLTETSLMGL